MLQRFQAGAWQDVNKLEKMWGGVFEDCRFARREQAGAWVDVWPGYAGVMLFNSNRTTLANDGYTSIVAKNNMIQSKFPCRGSRQRCAFYCYFWDLDLFSDITMDIEITGEPTSINGGVQNYATGAAELWMSIDGGNNRVSMLPNVSFLQPTYKEHLRWKPLNQIIHSFSFEFGHSGYSHNDRLLYFNLSNLTIGGAKFKFDDYVWPS